jgi:hypothetical protein
VAYLRGSACGATVTITGRVTLAPERAGATLAYDHYRRARDPRYFVDGRGTAGVGGRRQRSSNAFVAAMEPRSAHTSSTLGLLFARASAFVGESFQALATIS